MISPLTCSDLDVGSSLNAGSPSTNLESAPTDERLKGIEPKIIELITNEVRSSVSCHIFPIGDVVGFIYYLTFWLDLIMHSLNVEFVNCFCCSPNARIDEIHLLITCVKVWSGAWFPLMPALIGHRGRMFCFFMATVEMRGDVHVEGGWNGFY